jgi:hypothetical protein
MNKLALALTLGRDSRLESEPLNKFGKSESQARKKMKKKTHEKTFLQKILFLHLFGNKILLPINLYFRNQ